MPPSLPVESGPLFTADQYGDTLIIRLKLSCLDSRLSDHDTHQIRNLLTRYRQIVLDMADVSTTNGTGMYTLAAWIGFARTAGNTLVLARCCGQILALLGVLRISRIVPVASDLPEALACFDPWLSVAPSSEPAVQSL